MEKYVVYEDCFIKDNKLNEDLFFTCTPPVVELGIMDMTFIFSSLG